MGGLKILN